MTCVLVIGPHRSGTSMLAGACERLGVEFGRPEEGWPTYDSNPLGQYEDSEFVDLFKTVAGNWRFPQTAFTPMKAVEPIRAAITARVRDYNLWGIKNPLLCFPNVMNAVVNALLALQEPTIVFCISRTMDHAAQSLHMREPLIDVDTARWLTGQYRAGQLAVQCICATHRIPYYQLDYEELLAHPEQVQDIARVIGVPPSETAEEYIRPEMNHHA